MAMANDHGPIPVLVVSGFLGSGKTTLLGNLLLDPEAGEIAVIVNEFGEVGIDHHLVRKTDVRTTLLRNGCVCCLDAMSVATGAGYSTIEDALYLLADSIVTLGSDNPSAAATWCSSWDR